MNVTIIVCDRFSKFEKRLRGSMYKGMQEPGLQAFCGTNENIVKNLKEIERVDEMRKWICWLQLEPVCFPPSPFMPWLERLNDEIRLEFTGLSEEQFQRWEKSRLKIR